MAEEKKTSAMDAFAFLGALAMLAVILGGIFYLLGWLVNWLMGWSVDSDGFDKHAHRFGVGLGTVVAILAVWAGCYWVWVHWILVAWHHLFGG